MSKDGRLLHTVRDVGAVTHALCQLTVGDVLGVRGPFGSAWPIDSCRGRDIVVAAGGIGLAPLRPLLEHVTQHRSAYDDVVLLYGARTPDQRLYIPDLRRWRQADIQVEETVDHADRSWSGHVGVVTTLMRRKELSPHGLYFMCGPEIMMRFAIETLLEAGVPAERIHVTMERNMKCAASLCGRCQYGPYFACRDGPVFRFDEVATLFHEAGF